jgi:anaerobic magnesium-protoporphyrin IX monomethyl ester cyclase
MKVLLIYPPDEMEAMLGVGKEFVQKYEPLGLLYIAALVRQHGYDVSVVDAYAENLDAEGIKRRILDVRPDVVGFSVLTCNGAMAYDLGKWTKDVLPGALVVFGNVHASVYAKPYLENGCCDVVVHGEGEYPFLKILEARRWKGSFNAIPAVSFRADDGRVIHTEPGAFLVPDLAELPRPARELVDRRLYFLDNISNQLYVGKAKGCSKTMSTSRGCYYRCTFCVVNQKPRFNDPVRVVDEMEYMEKDYGADYVLVIDPLCMFDQPRMFRICEEIRRRKLKIKWGCDARVSCINPDIVRAMDSANCFDLSFGIESGVQKLLNNVRKGTKIPHIVRAVQTVKEYSDIQIGGLFILGLPGETHEDSLETIRFAKSLPLDMAQFSLCTPYPGSALFDELSAKGELDTGIRPDGTLDTSVWKRYSAYISFTDNDPIWTTPGRTAAELKALQKRAQREFYLRPSQIVKQMKRIRPSNVLRSIRILQEAFA